MPGGSTLAIAHLAESSKGKIRPPSTNRAKYNASILAVLNTTTVEIGFRREADHRPILRPNVELKSPTSSDPTNVPIAINEDISC